MPTQFNDQFHNNDFHTLELPENYVWINGKVLSEAMRQRYNYFTRMLARMNSRLARETFAQNRKNFLFTCFSTLP